MDSEHRHELQENDLRESLSNWRETWDKYGTPITVAVLLVVVVFAGYRLYDTYTASKREAAWGELSQTSSPEGLAQVAEQHSLQPVRMLALLRAADLHLLDTIFVAESAAEPGQDAQASGGANANTEGGGGGEEQAGDAEDSDASVVEAVRPAETREQKQRLERAETMYRRVLEEAEAAEFRANALLGLAAVAESREQWDAAADGYAKALDLAAESELPGIAAVAEHRRQLLDKLRQPVAIVEAPEPEPQPNAGAGAGTGTGDAGEAPLDGMIDVPNLLEDPATAPAGDAGTDAPDAPDATDAAEETAESPDGAGDETAPQDAE